MKKLIYFLPLLICTSNISAKNFGKGFAWGSFAGFTSGIIANESRRYRQPCRPSLYVVNQPTIQPYVYIAPEPVQPQVVYYPQRAPLNEVQHVHVCQDERPKNEIESKQLELQIIKEQNKKKELALREKELDIQILKLKQV